VAPRRTWPVVADRRSLTRGRPDETRGAFFISARSRGCRDCPTTFRTRRLDARTDHLQPEARNALHPDIYAASAEALEVAARDDSIRAVILTGADGVFCAGGNLNRLLGNRSQPPSVQADSIEVLNQWIESFHAFPKPIIAAVEGPPPARDSRWCWPAISSWPPAMPSS
jgi:hypothetical protein